MKLFSSACAIGLLASAALACGDDPADDGEGGSGTGTGASTGNGGSGAGPPVCVAGSHETSPGVCEATLGGFVETTPITNARDHHMTFAAKRPSGTYLFVGGGHKDMASHVPSIERALIQSDGRLGPWVTLAAETHTSGAVVGSTNDFVIFAGGYGTIKPSLQVETFSIDDAGELSGPNHGPEMSIARFHGGGVLVNGWLYATGGLDADETSGDTVERISVGGGTLGTWIAEPSMTDRRSHHGLATNGEFLFATGGLERVDGDFNADVPRTDVLRAAIREDGSLDAWQSITPLPFPIGVHSSFVHAGMLYLVGGLDLDQSLFLNTVYRAPVGADGSVGAWEELAVQLPKRRGHTHQTPIVDGFLYSVAGTAVSGSQIETYFARFE